MEHSKLAEALAAFHADLPDVAKGSTNPAFKSKYADLADIVKFVLPKLPAQGVAWIVSVEKTLLRHRFSFTAGNQRRTTVDQ